MNEKYSTNSADYRTTYQRWLAFEQLEPSLRKELENINDPQDIEDRFSGHLQFGTGGLRGIIGAGTNRVNRYTIRRATAGLANFLLSSDPGMEDRGVVIAYDSRHLSKELAEEAAGVLADYEIVSYLFDELRPTPMLSFAVRHLRAAAGIVITASHNPQEYNGYKVYGMDGGQITEDLAEQILQHINRIDDELTINAVDIDDGEQAGLIRFIGEEIDQVYTNRLLGLSLHPEAVKQAASDFRIVFTPLHGTGNKPMRRILNDMGFRHIQVVKEQELPDPSFSTIVSPNPENPSSFALALDLAKKCDAHIVMGTDPDADRMGVFARDTHGEYRMLTGNQTGALLLHYLLEQKTRAGTLPANSVMIKTIVTSEHGRKIAAAYGVETVDTLTGFKYIGRKIKEFRENGQHTFVFGYEESYGYLIGDFVRDKDAIQAGMLVCEMAAFYHLQGVTLHEVLDQLYEKFGYYREDLVSLTLQGQEGLSKITAIMDHLRHSPLTEIGGSPVEQTLDYAQGISDLPPSNVLKYVLTDGSWVAVRPSGTEPKIKFYFGAVGGSAKEADTRLEKIRSSFLALVEK